MKYMLLIYMGEQAMSEDERQHCYVDSAQLARDLHANGRYLAANPLHPVATATSVRVRDVPSHSIRCWPLMQGLNLPN